MSPVEEKARLWDHRPTPRARLRWGVGHTGSPPTFRGDAARVLSQPYREHPCFLALTIVIVIDFEDE